MSSKKRSNTSDEDSDDMITEWEQFRARIKGKKAAAAQRSAEEAADKAERARIVAEVHERVYADANKIDPFNVMQERLREAALTSFADRVVDYEQALKKAGGPTARCFEVWLRGGHDYIDDLAANELVARHKDDMRIESECYTDVPDPDGPYGFKRTYMKFHCGTCPGGYQCALK